MTHTNFNFKLRNQIINWPETSKSCFFVISVALHSALTHGQMLEIIIYYTWYKCISNIFFFLISFERFIIPLTISFRKNGICDSVCLILANTHSNSRSSHSFTSLISSFVFWKYSLGPDISRRKYMSSGFLRSKWSYLPQFFSVFIFTSESLSILSITNVAWSW